MNSLTLNDLSGNAFRMLGLTAAASQAEIDAAARKMRIWQDPGMIPASVNDAGWIGPIFRTRQNIENAVARLADPPSRIEERFWWFCLTPPASDAPPAADPFAVPAFHDAALVHLYRGLLTGISDENFVAWRDVIEQFQKLADSDDYLQWLLDVESFGDFEKRARVEEIAGAQQRLPARLSTAIVGSLDEVLADGDFSGAIQAVQLARGDRADDCTSDPAEKLIDRMEDDLAGRCNELTEKINIAWKTRLVSELRPACNHVMSRFSTMIQALIDQLVRTTRDVDRQNRARMIGIGLLIRAAEAYEAIENFVASQRALEAARTLAAKTPMESTVVSLLNKVKQPAHHQRACVPRGMRRQGRPQYTIKPPGGMNAES